MEEAMREKEFYVQLRNSKGEVIDWSEFDLKPGTKVVVEFAHQTKFPRPSFYIRTEQCDPANQGDSWCT